MRTRLPLFLFFPFIGALVLESCRGEPPCTVRLTCPSDEGGGGSGGDATGGGGGSTSLGGSGTGGAADPCDACDGATPFCDDAKECVECLETTDCDDPTKSVCDEGACVGCEENADCERFADTPVCDEGSGACVECTPDTEAARCGDFTCSSLTNTCTNQEPGLLDACDACESDSQCAPDRMCVQHRFGVDETDVGYFCFLVKGATGCGDTVELRRPYRRSVEAISLDGSALETYCFPPATTTCEGIRDTQNKSCTQDSECGVPELNDGYCPTTGPGAGLCSYPCGGGVDCNGVLSCGGSPQHCRP